MFDVYSAVTEKILAALEAGTAPWRKPWATGTLPTSLSTGKAYRGINVLLLGMLPFDSPFWGTFKQVKARGGKVRKGEKGTLVVFWKRINVADKTTGDDKVIPLLRYYKVFNAEQCDGITVPESKVKPLAHSPIASAEKIVSGYRNGPTLEWGGSVACYAPALDTVRMPNKSMFETVESYYQTLFHELVHSTGHADRLDREIGTPSAFGSEDYSREELIAECGAAMLTAVAGIDPDVGQSASYLDHWRQKLSDDPKLIVQAAAAGQRASDHILGVTFSDDRKADS